ncbi:MAG TPA: hypothetical protein VHX63_14075 [Acidobacteriaceae bacterium]|jgi:hypothetical protein|nr:hypothetical protein [Acidobacteriaceae bacterium]
MPSFQSTDARAGFRIVFASVCATVFLFCGATSIHAQAATTTPNSAASPGPAPASTPAPAPSPSEGIRPAIPVVESAVDSLDIDHWKLPRQAKSQVESDAASIRQDLSGTLPTLLDEAKTAPMELAPQWAVVRNVDALYDVLLRVTTTATLTGSSADASLLVHAENQLSETRRDLTAQLVTAAGAQDKEVRTLHTRLETMAAQQAVVRPPSKTIVVNNTPKHHVRHHGTKTSKKPTGTPSSSTPAATGSAAQPGTHP